MGASASINATSFLSVFNVIISSNKPGKPGAANTLKKFVSLLMSWSL